MIGRLSMLAIVRRLHDVILLAERRATPVFDLGIRLYVGQVFFRSGWLKISDWSTTLLLFENDYHVPLLSPHAAAVLGAAGELALPVLLVLGLAGRFAAAGLTVVNLVAAISFPDISDLGLQDHLLWGSLLLVILFHGPGRFSFDHRLRCELASTARRHDLGRAEMTS